jgi:hypothetical protein
MQATDDEASRVETIVAGLLYLMTQHARTGCPRLTVYIFRHMQCLACHSAAPAVLPETCALLRNAWNEAAPHAEQLAH